MRILDVITSKPFVKHIIIASLAILLLFWFTFRFIGCYTRHGDEIMVPNLLGVQVSQINEADPDANFEFLVIDSVFDDGYEKGAVVLQDPPASSMVKKGRKVYLTINSSQPEMVAMPNLVDLSLRQALNIVKSAGLKIGTLEYVDHFAKNAVLGQKYEGFSIQPGVMLQKGSPVQLVLGKGLEAEIISVPFLIGKSEEEAFDFLNNAMLNVGNVTYFDEKDKLHSRVYLQSPATRADTVLVPGSSVDLWFKSDLDFDFDRLIKSMEADTIVSDSLSEDTLF